MRPDESRKIFEEKGWRRVAALQLRNPMHRSHEFLAKIAVEVMDGVYIHQLVGKLKAGDIPADVRVNAINVLVDNYFVKDTVVNRAAIPWKCAMRDLVKHCSTLRSDRITAAAT